MQQIFNETFRDFDLISRKKFNSCTSILDKPSDFEKISRVKRWEYVDNPVIGTCRLCGYRGFVNHPCIGLY